MLVDILDITTTVIHFIICCLVKLWLHLDVKHNDLILWLVNLE